MVDLLDQWIYVAVTAGGAVVSAILLWLIVISKDGYSQSDVEAHADDFGHVVKEGHGPMLLYLWVLFAVVLITVIAFWIIYWPSLTTINTY